MRSVFALLPHLTPTRQSCNTTTFAQMVIDVLVQQRFRRLESLGRCERRIVNYPGFVQLGRILIQLRRSL
jgi:hypothetical protein